MQVDADAASHGAFEGTVTERWEILDRESPIQLGATFTSEEEEVKPERVAVNGRDCAIQPE